MIVKMNIKQLGKKRNKIEQKDFYLEHCPQSVKELLVECVRTCVTEYNARVEKGECARVLTSSEIEDMSEIGKIAFGINYGSGKQEETAAIENALQSFEDGLVRVFLGDKELKELEETVELQENDSLTFIRMTMLSGRMTI